VEYRRLGHTGLAVSEISLGSWLTFGSSVDREGTRKMVHHALERGVNLFDTADVYANGAGEEALGYALQGIPRAYAVIASKCFFPLSERPNDRGLSRKHIFESVEGSLRRLDTDYLDLLQCHRADPHTPLEETVGAFEDLIRQGKILYWGVSEWPADTIEQACSIADRRLAYRPISNQPQYSILRRGIESEVLPACERAGLGQIVFSPLAQGALTGKYQAGSRPDRSRGADPQRNVFMSAFLEPEALTRIESLRPLASECGLSMAQLALAWCLRQPGVSSVIVGVTRAEQLEDNLAASGVALPDDVVARIDALFPSAPAV
jgi:aryl-alcohol dehydrogenase-like predicted oxidoreductase